MRETGLNTSGQTALVFESDSRTNKGEQRYYLSQLWIIRNTPLTPKTRRQKKFHCI